MQPDELKKPYQISNLRLGVKYDLSDPSKWENGGEGGITLEPLGTGTGKAYIAIVTSRLNAAGEITDAMIVGFYYSGDSAEIVKPIFERSNGMSDINPSAENIRGMLTENLEQLRKASAEHFALLEKVLISSPLPIADQAKQFCNFMQRNVGATFDLSEKLIQAKDMQDALKMQSEFFQDQMRALTDQAKSMGETAMKAATGIFTPKN